MLMTWGACFPFFSIVTIRREIVRLLPVPTVDLGGVHEAHHVDSVLRLQLKIVNLFGTEVKRAAPCYARSPG